MRDRLVGWWSGTPFGAGVITRLNTLLAVVLGGGVIVAVSGVTNSSNPQGGVLACAAALLLVVPISWRRDHALAAMAVIAFGALFNWLVVGHYARCGAALPALALISFSVGSRCDRGRMRLAAGVKVPAVVATGGGAGGAGRRVPGSERPAAEGLRGRSGHVRVRVHRRGAVGSLAGAGGLAVAPTQRRTARAARTHRPHGRPGRPGEDVGAAQRDARPAPRRARGGRRRRA